MMAADRPPGPGRLPLDLLLRLARREVEDDDAEAPVPCLVALHRRPVREVFDRAAALAVGRDATDRALGVLILRELGAEQPDGSRPFTAETIPLLRDRLRDETDSGVLRWIISALQTHRAVEALPEVLACAGHPDARVRFHVAAGMSSLVNLSDVESEAAGALMRLCHDEDADIRFYALYAATREIESLDPEALADVIEQLRSDPDDQVRAMAAGHHAAVQEVRRLLNLLDAGTCTGPETGTSGYDSLIGPVLVGLACEGGTAEISDLLRDRLQRRFGVSPSPADIRVTAERMVAWWRGRDAIR